MNTVTLPILLIPPIKRRPSITRKLDPSWVLVSEINERYQVVLKQEEYDHDHPSPLSKPFKVYTVFIYDAILKEEKAARDARTYVIASEIYLEKIKVCIDFVKTQNY